MILNLKIVRVNIDYSLVDLNEVPLKLEELKYKRLLWIDVVILNC